MVLHDFTPCVDDELEVKRGQVGWWTFRHLNHHPFIIALSPSSPSSFSSLYKRVNIDVPDDKESQFLNSEALPSQPTTEGGANTIFPPSDRDNNNFNENRLAHHYGYKDRFVFDAFYVEVQNFALIHIAYHASPNSNLQNLSINNDECSMSI